MLLFQSTHPARGAPAPHHSPVSLCFYFNPRTPRGVRRIFTAIRPSGRSFQSTHPARGATPGVFCSKGGAGISIHAPREGCDGSRPGYAERAQVSQSTHPARGATGVLPYTRSWSRYFNPRTPRGVRPGGRSKPARQMRFQSTHPARGATGQGRIVTGRLTFQSTHPARGATATCWRRPFLAANFNPRTPRGVRRGNGRLPRRREAISIHAPREGCDKSGAADT